MLRTACAGALALVALARAPVAQLAEFEERRAADRAVLVAGLEEHADWCRAHKLFLTRKEVLEILLVLDPEHGMALRALGYRKDREGRWLPPKNPKRFKDYDQDALEEVPARYAAALAPYLERAHAMLQEELSPDQRLVVVDDILLVDENDAELRRMRGEVLLDGRWVLRETPAGIEGRAALRAKIRKALAASAEAEVVSMNDREALLDLSWGAVLATPHFRVLVTGGEAEARRVAGALCALREAHADLFELGGRLPEDCTVYLLRGEKEKLAFLGSHPDLDDAKRAAISHLSGSGVPETGDVVYWEENEERRLDGCLRTLLGHMFGAYGISVQQHPWIHEGMGLYLTDAVIGTRLSWYVTPRDPSRPTEDAELAQDLLRSPDWMELAKQVLQGDYLPRVRTLVTRKPEEFTSSDLLYAYVLAAYLIEAHPEQTATIVRRIGAGRRSTSVLEEILGFDPEVLDRRIRRWVMERPL